MKALITGGAGFIGSHLADRLLADGHQVVVLDDLSTGRPENLENAHSYSHFTMHHIDMADLDGSQAFYEGVDWVFHLGALADIVPSITNPMKYHRANVDGTISVLESSRRAGVKRFIYSASASCYGLPDESPTPEAAEIRPMYPYALTKNVGEQYVMHWNNIYGLPAVALRLFNVYGPRSRTSGTYGAVFGVFLAQKLAGDPFTVVGDGEQTRDFVFVSDVADAFVKAAQSHVQGEAFNVGSGGTYSINRLVSLLGGKTIYVDKRPGEPECTFADISKLTGALDWRPLVSFDEGVKVMLDNIDYWRNAPVWNSESITEATRDWFKYLGNAEEASVSATRSSDAGAGQIG